MSEGIFTVVLGFAVLFFLPDCMSLFRFSMVSCKLIFVLVPDTAKWLSENEKAFVTARLPINAPRSAESDFNLAEFIRTLKDYKLWLFLSCWAFYTIGTTGLQFYQPTVIANLGFT